MAATYKLLITLLACCVLVEVINGLKPLHSQEVKAALPPTVFGFVFCDSCLEKIYTRNTIVIPNVTASIACENFQATNTTSELGVFTFQIPTDIANSPTKLATCSVKVTHDPLKVQGDLNTCNKPVEFSAGNGQLSASSVPHSSQDGWPFYGVGPFVYQPLQALPFCQKKDQSPSFGPFHGTAPPYGNSLAPLPAFQVAALPPLPFPIESALPPIPVESSTPPTVHPPPSPFPFHQAPPAVVHHKAQPLPAFAHPPVPSVSHQLTPPTATGSKVPPFQHGQSLPPLPSQFPRHAHPPTSSGQSDIPPQQQLPPFPWKPMPKGGVPPSQDQASAPAAGKQETHGRAFPPRNNHPIGHLQVPAASPTRPAPAADEAVPPVQHISPASPANAPAALPSAPPPSIRRAPASPPRSSHQPPPAFTLPSPPPSHISPPNPPRTHPSPPFIPRQVPPPPFHTSRRPPLAPHQAPPPPSHTNPRNPPLQHPNPPPSHTNPRNPPLQHPNPPPSHTRPGNPVHPNPPHYVPPPPSHVNHRTPPPSHLNHRSPPPLRHPNPPSPRHARSPRPAPPHH